MSRTWSNPVPLEEYLARIPAGSADGAAFAAWVRGQGAGFACPKHLEELPSIEYHRDLDRLRVVCAPCRRAS